jgi:hypothetical protein
MTPSSLVSASHPGHSDRRWSGQTSPPTERPSPSRRHPPHPPLQGNHSGQGVSRSIDCFDSQSPGLSHRCRQVRVLEHGLLYEGTIYPSLSAVAKAVTGSHCSGYRFFRLLPKGVASAPEPARPRPGSRSGAANVASLVVIRIRPAFATSWLAGFQIRQGLVAEDMSLPYSLAVLPSPKSTRRAAPGTVALRSVRLRHGQ